MTRKALPLQQAGIAAFFLLCTLCHYPDQFSVPEAFRLTTIFSLERHALERMLYVLPAVWAGYSLSRRAAFFVLGASFAAMMPRVFLISEFRSDAVLETFISIVFGLVAIVLLDTRKRESFRGEEIGRLAMLYNEEIDHSHEEERRRIARELHDDTIQRLVAISRRIESLSYLDDEPSKEVSDVLEVVRADILGTIDGVRNCIRNIRSPVLELLGPLAAIRDFTESTGKEGFIRTDFTTNVDSASFNSRFSGDRGVMLYRFVQEAVRNAVRHSGTDRIDVSIEEGKGGCVVEVRDFGSGIKPEGDYELLKTRRLGILGMRERVRLLGGELSIRRHGDGGTVVRAVLGTAGGR